MENIWISAAGLSAATVLGSLIGFCVKDLPHKWNDTILGLCAGIMLAASTIGLIVPAAGSAGLQGWWIVAAGAAAGALFLNILDLFTPHLHKLSGIDSEAHSHNSSVNRILLFVMAIAIHKFPEGMAAGVGFNADNLQNAWAVTIGIALQNIPEGMVVIAPLLLAGASRMRTFAIALSIALLEVAGVWTGYIAGAASRMLLPFMLSFAGGAMLYVVSDEMIPETHAHGYQKQATYALVAGFILMLYTDMFFQ